MQLQTEILNCVVGSFVVLNGKRLLRRLLRNLPSSVSVPLPIQYYNYFELSGQFQFDPESDPKSRLATGIPVARYGEDGKQ